MNVIRCQGCEMILLQSEKIDKVADCLCGVRVFCPSCYEKQIKSEIQRHEQMQHFGMY